MDEQAATPEPQPVNKATAVAGYDSNPFNTTFLGIKKLFSLNTGPLIGVTFFNIVLTLLIVLAGAAAILAFAALIIKGASAEQLYALQAQFPPDSMEMIQSFNGASIYATLIGGLAIVALLATVMQVMQIKLLTASAASQKIGFGELFKQGFTRALPLFGLMVLSGVIGIIAVVLSALLLSAVPLLAPVLLFVLFILAIYVGVRISLASFSIVDEKLGPIKALKRSWALSRGHFGELVGIIAATGVLLLPVFLIEGATQDLTGSAISVLQVVLGVAALIITTIAGMGFAERFQQLRQVADGGVASPKTHIMNYLAVVIFIVGSIIIGVLFPQKQTSGDTKGLEEYLQNSQQQSPSEAEDFPLYDGETPVPEDTSEEVPSYYLN